MKLTVIIAGMLAMAGALLADAPFLPNVRAAEYGDSINMGETAMAIFGQRIYLISNTNERGTYAVAPFGRSTDGGLTWLPTFGFRDTRAPNNWHSDPCIVVDSTGGVHMLMQFSTTVTKHYLSLDGGNTWAETSEVTDRSTGGAVDKDWMIYDHGNFYVMWQEINGGTQQGIRFAKSTDNGRTWTRTTIVPYGAGITALCTDYNRVIYVTYNTWDEMYFMKSTDLGSTWSTPEDLGPVTYTAGWGDRAPLQFMTCPANGVIFLAWTDQASGDWDIVYRRSTDGGDNWSPVAILNDSTVGAQFKIWVTSDPYGGIHAIYYSTSSWPTSSSSQLAMRYRYSVDGGATFRPSLRLSDATFTTGVTFLGEYHMVVCDSERVYTEWADGRSGHNEIYFTSAALSALGAVERPGTGKQVAGVELVVPEIGRPGGALAVNLAQTQNVRLEVFDASGRVVKVLHAGRLAAGSTTFLLDGLPLNRALFVKLSGGANQTRKFIVLP
jgi:hypothetical protein